MKENPQDVLTVEVFNRLLDEKLGKLDEKMMSGFEVVFNRFEKLENKIDSLIITKADTGEILLLEKRITKLENKIA